MLEKITDIDLTKKDFSRIEMFAVFEKPVKARKLIPSKISSFKMAQLLSYFFTILSFNKLIQTLKINEYIMMTGTGWIFTKLHRKSGFYQSELVLK